MECTFISFIFLFLSLSFVYFFLFSTISPTSKPCWHRECIFSRGKKEIQMRLHLYWETEVFSLLFQLGVSPVQTSSELASFKLGVYIPATPFIWSDYLFKINHRDDSVWDSRIDSSCISCWSLSNGNLGKRDTFLLSSTFVLFFPFFCSSLRGFF